MTPPVLPVPSENSVSVGHRKVHWRANLRITTLLLVIWFAVTFGVSYFARELVFRLLGWPFSFWVAAQGALVVYCLIVGGYAWYMNRLDRKHGLDEVEP